MKKIISGLALVAAAYFVSSFNVEIKISENQSSASCEPSNPVCGG